ncbi:unnamed protein product, partial [marine sediment metagenome]
IRYNSGSNVVLGVNSFSGFGAAAGANVDDNVGLERSIIPSHFQIGNGKVGVDYWMLFDGANDNGIIKFNEGVPQFEIDQPVVVADALTATTLDTGQAGGPFELYGILKDLLNDSTITITNGGNNTLYGPDGDITFAVTSNSIGDTQLAFNTGQELSTISSPTFVNPLSTSYYKAQGVNPGFWLDETGGSNKGAYFVLDNLDMQIQRRVQGFGGYEATPFKVNLTTGNATFLGTVTANSSLCCADYVFKDDYDLLSLD